MAVLSTQQRKQMPQSAYALPGKRYPINDPNHARDALARASQNASPAEQSQIKAKVAAKYPQIDQKQKTAKELFQ